MRSDIFQQLGGALKAARRTKGLTQGQLAKRLGREQGRVSELETDLVRGRLGKDRLTLLAEICDALDLVPVLMPRAQASAMIGLQPGRDANALAHGSGSQHAHGPPRSTFEELFVDLGDEDEENPDG
uniref:Transcriptional regulator, XRE family n=1 Tax=Caulobacter sp. (strain K31) TaxID=366602 RepID=B0T5I3_CAUSK